jgi:hypothetical protein
MSMKTRWGSGLLALGVLAAAGSASAATVTWADWTGINTPLTGASGMMGSVGITVTATNAMDGVTQLQGPGATCVNVGGTVDTRNFWTEPDAADKPYTGGTVSNGPTACEQIGLDSANSVTVTFSSAVSTLYMALLSVGRPSIAVTYDFDQAFVIDSEGQGFWGNDITGGIVGAGDTLTMREFHGLLRFAAPVTSLTFNTDRGEFWHAYTFGMASAPVPTPGSLALVGLALLAGGMAARRGRSA